ncbi:hypothetical protein [Methylosinus sporium]|uniref:hypothetical protein n=1 Tax=Methylosinus sporium TaxID=428 RepID=UPI003DA73471
MTESTTASSIAGLLSTYPQGGEALTAEVKSALLNDPATADLVVMAGNKANAEQAGAIALGILQALRDLDQSNREGAAQVRQALRLANKTLAAVLAAVSAQQNADGSANSASQFLSEGGFSSSGGGGGLVVPPNVSPN